MLPTVSPYHSGPSPSLGEAYSYYGIGFVNHGKWSSTVPLVADDHCALLLTSGHAKELSYYVHGNRKAGAWQLRLLVDSLKINRGKSRENPGKIQTVTLFEKSGNFL